MGFHDISEGKESEMKVLVTQSYQTLCDPRDRGHQSPLSMEFFR